MPQLHPCWKIVCCKPVRDSASKPGLKQPTSFTGTISHQNHLLRKRWRALNSTSTSAIPEIALHLLSLDFFSLIVRSTTIIPPVVHPTTRRHALATMTQRAVNLKSRVGAITSHWSPELILTMNDSHSIKVATINGAFDWHCHPDTDEVFYCVSGGPFRIELSTEAGTPEEADKLGRDDAVEMSVGDVFCVPKGMQHRPVADVTSGILMIEKVGTVNTGDRVGNSSFTDHKLD